MAEVVNIASLTIDINDVEMQSVKLKKELESLKKAQKALDKTTDEGAAAYEALQGKIKNTSKAYKDNQQFASALDATNKDLTKTLKIEGKSTQELYDSRSQLNKIAKNIQGNTEEEIALRNKLNDTIDEQTQAIKKQAPGYIEQKENIGAYTEGINLSDLSLNNLIKTSEESGGAMQLLTGGIKSGTKAMSGLIKSTLKFIATPVGLILAAIAGAFLLIKNAMDRSEDSTNKIKKSMSGFAGIVKGLSKLLAPLGDFLIDGLVRGFELVEKGISKALAAIQKGLKFLGLDGAAEALGNFTEKMEDAVETSKQLTQAEIDLQKAQRLSRKIQLDYQKDAEKLRQIRDDESKSIEERIAANEKLGKVLQKQSKEEEAIAQKAIDLANYRIELEGETTDALNERAEALTELTDIQERIVGQESEQLVNVNSLLKEQNEIIAEKIQVQEDFQKQLEDDAQNELDILEDKFDKELDLEFAKNDLLIEANQEKVDALLQQELKKIEQEKIANEELSNLKKQIINTLFNLSNDLGNRRIEKLNNELKAETISEKKAANEIAKIKRRQAIVDKAQGLFNVYLNTSEAITKAGAQLGAFALPVQIALGILGGAQAASIISQPLPEVPTFKTGGLVRGAGTSKSDSIPALLSNGESVNNANSTSMFAPLYSYLNELGGGARFANGGIAGATKASNSFSIIDYDLLAEKFGEAASLLPAPQVDVLEIQEVGNNVQVIEDLATT